MNIDNQLHEDDYTLAGSSCWLTVGDFSVWIRNHGDGVSVEIYGEGKEMEDCFDSAYAGADDLELEPQS